MSDPRLFIKLHNGFPEHPKTVGLTDKAFRGVIELWCYCSRNKTDGIVLKAQVSRIIPPKTIRELIAAGYLIDDGDTMEMHDYLEHQESAEDIKNRRMARVEAGRLGGKAKANGLASARAKGKQTPSKPLPDKDKDKDLTTPNGVVPRTRASRIPEGFAPTPDMLIWAAGRAPHVDIGLSTEKFINYWTSKTTAATKLDWAATWRNWILSDQERATKQPKQFLTAAERKLQHGAQLMQHFQTIENQQNQIGA
jgi:hypothetical protein